MKRIESIDMVRGLVMVIMALDHTRDLMHVHSIDQSPTDLATTTGALFFTRWITHLCAPTFVFLAGSSAYLSFRAQGNLPESRRFLLKRGLWLLLLEFTVVNFGIWFDLGFHTFMFSVIAAIGLGLVILSGLLKLSVKTIGGIGLGILLLHNLLPLIPFPEGSMVRLVLSPLFGPGEFPIGPSTTFIMGYSPIPWLGVLLTGFAAGNLFELTDAQRKPLFLKIGLASIAAFILIRLINIYGDPVAWSSQKDVAFSFMSFMNLTKYPPSLLFCLATLGTMFLLLSLFERMKNKLGELLLVYGKVPLFYYMVHWYILHAILIIMMFSQGFSWADMDFAGAKFGRANGAVSGVPLWTVYLIWILVVMVMFPLCKWYGGYKKAHAEKTWLKYF
jgi:uncharacterized membrane protein